MKPKMVVLTVTSDDPQKILKTEVRSGLGLQAICLKNEIPLEYDCRKADCGICIFRVVEGPHNLSPKTPSEQDFLKAMHADSDERLACQTRILGDVTIAIENFDP